MQHGVRDRSYLRTGRCSAVHPQLESIAVTAKPTARGTRHTTHLSLFFALCGCLLLSPAIVAAQDTRSAAPMLERVLPSVVTVAVYKSQEAKRAFGFAGDGSDAAYHARPGSLRGSEQRIGIHRGTGGGNTLSPTPTSWSLSAAKMPSPCTVNQTKYPVRVIGGDSFYDLAVLEFTSKQPGDEVRTVGFAEAGTPHQGSVFAVGNPPRRVPPIPSLRESSGEKPLLRRRHGEIRLSAEHRHDHLGEQRRPVGGCRGKVVGVNSRIEIRKMGEQMYIQPQINFALETRLTKRIFEDVLTNQGRMRRPFFGLEIVQRAIDWRAKNTREVGLDEGPMIGSVLADCPAARALQGKEHAS